MSDNLNAQIWAKLMEDAEFAGQPPAVIEASRPFIEHLPTLLADMLDSKVSLSVLMDSKLRWIRYCLQNGYIQAAVEAYPEEALGGIMEREDLVEMFQGMLEMVMELAESLTGDNLVETLKEYDISEEYVMLNSMGLNEEAIYQYDEGLLTIRTLLEIQPEVIVVNKQN